MAVIYTYKQQGITRSVGTGKPTHTGTFPEYYTDISTGYVYQCITDKVWFPDFQSVERVVSGTNASNATRASYGIVTSAFATTSGDATDSTTNYTHYDTSVTAGGYGGIETTSFNEFPINSDPYFLAVIKTPSSISNIRLWVGLFSATLLNLDTQVGSAVATFRFSSAAGDTGWKAITSPDGISVTTSSDIGTVAINTQYILEIYVDYANTKVHFRVNGGAITTLSTNLPSTGQKMGWCVECTNPGAGSTTLNISRVKLNHK